MWVLLRPHDSEEQGMPAITTIDLDIFRFTVSMRKAM